MPTSTFYPDADPESTSVDGYVARGSPLDSWSGVHDGSGTTANDSGTVLEAVVTADSDSDTWNTIRRTVLLFDTSSLPNDATITAATLYLYVNSTAWDFGGDLDVTDSTPASNTSLSSSDYSNVGNTRYATGTAISGLSTGAYNGIALNATGLANISLIGVTKLALRISWDTDDSPPSWSDSGNDVVSIASADDSGTAQPPYLEVTYTEEASTGHNLSLLGVGQ